MEKKILLDNNAEQRKDINNNSSKDSYVKPNLFQGRIEAETNNAAFPDWDIIPPNQFINPRTKPQ
ncbi:MAG: hypothetical protein J0I41_15695 [Filimonas sp.]|nr:hypothetical protein [Filimonas sp.]